MCLHSLLCGKSLWSLVGLRQLDLSYSDSGRTLTEEGERDLNVPISRDKLQARKKTQITYILHTITILKY